MKFPFFDMGYKRHIKRPEDFLVEEVIDPKFRRKFVSKGSRVERAEKKHALCLLEKKNRTTESLIKEIAEKLGKDVKDIGYAGLKDRFAVARQYITIKGSSKEEIENLELKNAMLLFLQYTGKKISVGGLLFNRFEITLANLKNAGRVERNLKGAAAGFPNYFGPQRFGAKTNNHKTGMLLLLRRFKEAERLAGKRITRESARFFVHSYQSYLFNKALFFLRERAPKEAALLGWDFRARNVMEKLMLEEARKDGISPSDFRFPELRISCRGTARKTFAKPLSLSYRLEGKTLFLSFSLPKGSFATAMLQEILK